MVSIDTLTQELDILGFNPPENVLLKCLEICKNNDIEDAVEFADSWMAFSVSKCDGAEPTVDLLKDMELHEYINKKSKKNANKKAELIKPILPTSNDLLIYPNDVCEDTVLGSYTSNTPKSKQPLSRVQSSQIGFSPICYSPLTPNRKLNLENSNDSGHVVYTFGSSKLVKQTNWEKEESNKGQHVTIKCITPILCDDESSHYMYDPLYEKMTTETDIIYEIGQDIFNILIENEEKSAGSEEANIKVEISHIDGISAENQYCLGRIICNPDNKERRIGLIDFDDMKIRYATLEFGREKHGAVFSGQVAIVKGVNSRGNLFQVDNIYTDRPLTLSGAPILDKEISFVVASSPFTDKNDLLYEKLESLLQYCNKNNPDVVIFTGPIIESRNDLIANTVAEEFDNYFQMIMDKIASNIKSSTEIIIVSSHEDIVSTFVYPTHRYITKDKFKNVHFMSDPCIIDVNNIKLGITTVDIVKHLADNEVSYGTPKDQIKRIFSYMFQQKSFYPLQPPDVNVPIDQELLQKFGQINVVPNIMICPSELPVFIREINNCVCINPGHLTNNQDSENSKNGTFARMVIHPPASLETVPFNYAVCQVIKS